MVLVTTYGNQNEWGGLAGGGDAGRVALQEEQPAALGLVLFADPTGGRRQTA